MSPHSLSRLALIPFVLCLALPAAAVPMRPETRAALVTLRDAVRAWAPMCSNGAMGLTQPPECKQGDMLEYAGMSCLAGERARCEDVRRSQSADGRFWRNPTDAANGRTGGDGKNSFSRDMLMGVLDYALVTRDRASFERFVSYIKSHGRKMCPDATDNRCRLMPSTWGLVSLVLGKLGAKRPFWMRLSERTVDIDVFASSATAPKGFMLELIAHHVMVRRALGQNTAAMRFAAARIAKRQPLNPLYRYLHEGPTEEAAALARETCSPQKGALAHDIFFQRELTRNASGQIVVIRDWHDPVPPLARDVASGHDCLIVLNLLLGEGGTNLGPASTRAKKQVRLQRRQARRAVRQARRAVRQTRRAVRQTRRAARQTRRAVRKTRRQTRRQERKKRRRR